MKNPALVIILIIAIIIVGGILFYLNKSSQQIITDFESCVAAGYPILESYPRQCRTQDGRIFVEKISKNNEVVSYFIQEIRERGIENIESIPIEGFDPNLYTYAFPSMMEEDFNNAAAFGGTWLFTNSRLEFNRDSSQPITSAEGTVTDEGLATILDNLSKRFDMPLTSPRTVDSILDKIEMPLIKDDFGTKIVYSSAADAPQSEVLLKKDCNKRGGMFDNCGSVCAPDAEVCIEICAFTCENIQQ